MNLTAIEHNPILLFGGSFNPPHLAHFALVHAALSALKLEHCQIIPSGQPWQKPNITSVEHRLAMLQLAVHDDIQLWQQSEPTAPYPIDINPIETLNNQVSYTIDTLRTLRHSNPQQKFIWLIGSDQLTNFHTWRDWQGILKYTHIAVAQRANYETTVKQLSDPTLRTYYQQHRCDEQSQLWRGAQSHGCFIEFPAPLWAVSSTQIRAQIQQACVLDLGETLAKSVQIYIAEHNLYK